MELSIIYNIDAAPLSTRLHIGSAHIILIIVDMFILFLEYL